MKRQLLAASFATLLALVPATARAEKPSTPEDRARAVEIAKALESDPLGKHAKEQRSWVVRWLIEVPDIHVKACNSFLGPMQGLDKSYASDLFVQQLISGAAFVIENPDKAKDDLAVYAAGLQGALSAYESIVKAKPKAKSPFLDDLLEKRSKGELADYIKQAAVNCK